MFYVKPVIEPILTKDYTLNNINDVWLGDSGGNSRVPSSPRFPVGNLVKEWGVCR